MQQNTRGLQQKALVAEQLRNNAVVPGTVEVSSVSRTAGRVSLVNRRADLAAVIPEILRAAAVGLKVVGTGQDPLHAKILIVQLALPGREFILDCQRVNPSVLAPVLASARKIVGHDLKRALQFLSASGLSMPNGDRLFDVMLAAQLLGAGTEEGTLENCGLEAVAERELGVTLEASVSKNSAHLTEEQLKRTAQSAAVLLQLFEKLKRQLRKAELEEVANTEFRCLLTILWLERTGTPIDKDRWADLASEAELDVRLSTIALNDAIGRGARINWDNQEQVLRWLQSRGHEIPKLTDAALRSLASQEPLAKDLLTRRAAAIRSSTYGRKLVEEHLSAVTGRLHPQIQQLGAPTGRMSCSTPNLQGIPRDPAYRRCFRASEGRVLVKGDYSQIELRVAAEITGEKRMIAALSKGDDLHSLTAELVLGKQPGDLRPEYRQAAKALNFGLLYGMGAKKLKEYALASYGANLSESKALELRRKFFESYPRIRRWHQLQLEGPCEIRTLSGRRRLAVERFTAKLNTAVQGTCADGLKESLALLWERRGECPSAVPVLCVHDEIVLECDSTDAKRVSKWLVLCMKTGMEKFLTKVPVVVEVTVGRSWGSSGT